MQHAALTTYKKIAKETASPRDLEADLLLQAASKLQAVSDGWDGTSADLDDALAYNRKLWSIFLSSVTDPNNPLPPSIRQNVANLGIFVCNQTLSVLINREPSGLSALININRELAAGLRANE
jgi:flagellar protein FlaF